MLSDVLKPLILASASPRRYEILKDAGFAFTVEVPDVVENEYIYSDPQTLVSENAALKAKTVAALRPTHWVLGADTTVAIDNRVLNKPQDLDEARLMLRLLSGRTHTVYTGMCLIHQQDGFEKNLIATAYVTFKSLTDDMIEAYIEAVSVLDKAGAYGIQSHSEMIIERFTGLRSTIMGLPVEHLYSLLG